MRRTRTTSKNQISAHTRALQRVASGVSLRAFDASVGDATRLGDLRCGVIMGANMRAESVREAAK